MLDVLTNMLQLPSEITLALHLDPGENLLWSGQPCRGIRLRALDIFLIPFSLVWCGFAIFWEVSVVNSGAPFILKLWGVLFVCFGLFFVFGRFILDARNRARTTYGVTNERILIVSGRYSRQIKSLPLRTLTEVSFSQRSNGRGTLTFGSAPFMNGFLQASSWPGTGRYSPPSFDLIDGAKEVYDVIRHAQSAALAKT